MLIVIFFFTYQDYKLHNDYLFNGEILGGALCNFLCPWFRQGHLDQTRLWLQFPNINK